MNLDDSGPALLRRRHLGTAGVDRPLGPRRPRLVRAAAMTAEDSSPGPTDVHRFGDRRQLARELARSLAADLEAAVAERGAATLVVSGGSTPAPLFAELRRRVLPWDRVSVTLADERWVAAGDPASNEGLVRRQLLAEEAAAARWVGLKNDAPTPEAGRDECERQLARLPRPFDAVVLGMGADGHTASLFPAAAELAAGLDPESSRLCLAVRPPAAPHPRLSLTLAALLQSRRIVLHITGEEKWSVYRRALGEGPEAELPIRAVLRQAVLRQSVPHRAGGVEVYWAPRSLV